MTRSGLGGASSGSPWPQVPESDAIETIGAARDAITADLHAELMHEGLLREDAPVPT